jgi:hypothetical protein
VFSGIFGSFFPEAGLSRSPRTSLIWISTRRDVNGYGRMLWSDFDGDFSEPDTIMTTPPQDTEYGGCVVGSRRWAVRSDIVFPPGLNRIRIAYSEDCGPWHELPDREGIDEAMCAIGPIDSSRAMVVFAGQTGLAWVLLEGPSVSRRGILDPRPTVAIHPGFRVRPSGGLWTIWSDRTWIHVSSYRDGQWDRGDSLKAIHPPGETFIPAWSDMSRDGAERPVLTWGDLGYAYTYRDIGCAAFPTAIGWSDGEEIPGSDNIFLTPTVTVDRNGDAWFAWQLLRRPGLLFNHTYTKSVATKVSLEGHGRRRAVSWTLDEPAPGSWWTLLRARGDGPFEDAARVQAGDGLEVSWTDDSPPAGHIRYKVRRDCLDTRYRWESEEVAWPPGQTSRGPERRVPALKRPATPFGQIAELELTGAESDSYEVALYDLQGRRVLTQQAQGATTGRLRFSLEGAMPALVSGIYYAKVRDAAGVESNAVRIVVLR